MRIALGAPRHRVLLLVAREGLSYTAIGLGLGVVLAGGIGFALSPAGSPPGGPRASTR